MPEEFRCIIQQGIFAVLNIYFFLKVYSVYETKGNQNRVKRKDWDWIPLRISNAGKMRSLVVIHALFFLSSTLKKPAPGLACSRCEDFSSLSSNFSFLLQNDIWLYSVYASTQHCNQIIFFHLRKEKQRRAGKPLAPMNGYACYRKN